MRFLLLLPLLLVGCLSAPPEVGSVVKRSVPLAEDMPSPVIEIDGYLYQNHLAIYRGTVDGDTFDIDLHLGNNIWAKGERVRLLGLNTPETRTRDREEKARGLEAKEFTRNFLESGTRIWLLIAVHPDYSEDAFSRLLSFVYVDGIWLNCELLERGFARPDAR